MQEGANVALSEQLLGMNVVDDDDGFKPSKEVIALSTDLPKCTLIGAGRDDGRCGGG